MGGEAVAVLKSQEFTLGIERTIPDGQTDFCLNLSVETGRYSGKTCFYASEREWKSFVTALGRLYETLEEGSVILSDYEPDENSLEFSSDGLGHFTVKGVMSSLGWWTGNWSLKFVETLDQTYLKSFVSQLLKEMGK